MPRKLNIPLPSKGLTVDRPGEFVDPRAAAAIKNMEYSRAIIRKRFGTSAIGSTLSERIQRFFELQVGADSRLFRVGTTKVQVLNKSSNVWSSVAHAVLTGTSADPVGYAFPQLSGEKIAVFTNGVDAIRKCAITGNDAVLGGSPPKAKHALAYGSYLLLGNITDDLSGNSRPRRVQWCDTGDPENWSSGNAGSQELLDDPEDITGMGMFGNRPTIHKPNSIYLGQLLTTSAVFRFDGLATGVGAVAGATIQTLPSGEQIFLASDGLHLFNGLTAPLIESPIQDELRDEMNPEYAYKAQSIFVEELDEYWVCVATGSDTEPQTIYKYNWRTRQVYKDERTNLTALGVFLNTQEDAWDDDPNSWDSDVTRWNSVVNLSNSPIVIVGDSSGVAAKRTANSFDDAGVAVDGLWETKDFTAEDFGEPDADRMMRWKGLELWALGDSVTISYSTDGGQTFTLVPAGALSLSADYPTDSAPLQVYFDVVSSRLRLRFRNNTSEETYTIKKFQLEATPREARK